jgi:hypothetical protein
VPHVRTVDDLSADGDADRADAVVPGSGRGHDRRDLTNDGTGRRVGQGFVVPAQHPAPLIGHDDEEAVTGQLDADEVVRVRVEVERDRGPTRAGRREGGTFDQQPALEQGLGDAREARARQAEPGGELGPRAGPVHEDVEHHGLGAPGQRGPAAAGVPGGPVPEIVGVRHATILCSRPAPPGLDLGGRSARAGAGSGPTRARPRTPPPEVGDNRSTSRGRT